jgi:SAM-dependent methyltransferase
MITEDEIASWDYAKLWDKFPVPARPSKEELSYLKKELSRLKEPKVLILGSTIEYRSLCKKLGIFPYVADFDKSHYDILTSYSKEKFPSEHFIKIDWLKLNESNKYDAILGHRAFNVIGKRVVRKFFENMYHALKPGGVFYCKGNIIYKKQKGSLLSLIKKYNSKRRNNYPLFSYIEVELYFHCADKNSYIDYPKARKLMSSLHKNGSIPNKEYELIKILISMSSEARFRGKIKESEIRNVTKNIGFKDKWVTLDKEICSNMPIIKLAKPNNK